MTVLYNPSWQKPDLEYAGVSLRSFIAWLETKDPNESYPYLNERNCAVAQYKQHMGSSIEGSIVSLGSSVNLIPEAVWLNSIVVCGPGTDTFGGALVRARKTLADLEAQRV